MGARRDRLDQSVARDYIAELARDLQQSEDRGEDVTEQVLAKCGEDATKALMLLRLLRKIARGQMLPEVFVRFVGTFRLMRRIANLPIMDQERLARGEPVKLFDPSGSHMVDPLDMSKEEVRQVFAKDHIRTESEQDLFLYDLRMQSYLGNTNGKKRKYR